MHLVFNAIGIFLISMFYECVIGVCAFICVCVFVYVCICMHCYVHWLCYILVSGSITIWGVYLVCYIYMHVFFAVIIQAEKDRRERFNIASELLETEKA